MSNILYSDLSHKVIGIAFKVHSKLGSFLPEHCYQHAIEHELIKQEMSFTSQQKHDVYYDDEMVGHFYSDIIVDNKIILELKSTEMISSNHLSQLFTYLRVTKLRVGYVLNFGCKSLQFRRLIL